MCAIKWVGEHAKTYQFDTDQIVITGFSSGGYLALIAGLMHGEERLYKQSTELRFTVDRSKE